MCENTLIQWNFKAFNNFIDTRKENDQILWYDHIKSSYVDITNTLMLYCSEREHNLVIFYF